LTATVTVNAFVSVMDAPDSVSHHPAIQSVNSLVAEKERDPTWAAALAQARKRLGSHLAEHMPRGLRGLRLERGLSQTALAEAVGTSQSRIARIEAGREQISLRFASRLADALMVDMNALQNALEDKSGV